MLRKVRITLASLVMLFITLMFLDFTGTLRLWLDWLAKIQFLPALLALNVGVVAVLLLLTVLLGRIYCSVICPLGIMQDVIAHANRKKNRYHFSPERRWLRYGVLVVVIVAFFVGANALVAFVAPYSSYGRMVQNLLQPAYIMGNNMLARIAEHYGSYAFYGREVWMRSLPTLLIALATFIIIAVLAWRGGRTYCNTICPVGTLLSFFARFSFFKIRFDEDKCKQCGKCERNCKAQAIDFKHMTVDYSRCVVCGNCLDQCAFDSLHYSLPMKKKEMPKPSKDAGLGRRAFLASAALVTAGAAIAQEKKKVDGGLAVIKDKVVPERHTPITPPGSVSAANMQRHCTACQLCVSQCPNDVLRPSTGLATLMQPVMSYERGYCRPECNTCSQVCPTDAIKPITLAQKSATQVGHAVWVKKNCIILTRGVECGNCALHCPVGAITMTPLSDDLDSPFVPVVNEARCIGCGACENVCPSRPLSAIYVEGHEMHREV